MFLLKLVTLYCPLSVLKCLSVLKHYLSPTEIKTKISKPTNFSRNIALQTGIKISISRWNIWQYCGIPDELCKCLTT